MRLLNKMSKRAMYILFASIATFVLAVLVGGVWFYHFLYGQYIPERGEMAYIEKTLITSQDSILIYGADSSLADIEGSLSDHPQIYKAFIKVLLEYKKEYPDTVEGFIHGGDIVSQGSDQQITSFIRVTQPIREDRIPFFLVTGNEGGERGRQKLIETGLLEAKEPYYKKGFTNFSAIIINTELPLHRGTEQYKFLAEELSAAKNKEVVIFMHKPFITYGFHNNNLVEFKRKRFAHDILNLVKDERQKIIAVIQSEDHDYQRLNFHGLPVFVSGGLGEGLRATKYGPETEYAIDGIFHYLQILSNEDSVTISAVRFNEKGVLGEFDKLEIPLE